SHVLKFGREYRGIGAIVLAARRRQWRERRPTSLSDFRAPVRPARVERLRSRRPQIEASVPGRLRARGVPPLLRALYASFGHRERTGAEAAPQDAIRQESRRSQLLPARFHARSARDFRRGRAPGERIRGVERRTPGGGDGSRAGADTFARAPAACG